MQILRKKLTQSVQNVFKYKQKDVKTANVSIKFMGGRGKDVQQKWLSIHRSKSYDGNLCSLKCACSQQIPKFTGVLPLQIHFQGCQ